MDLVGPQAGAEHGGQYGIPAGLVAYLVPKRWFDDLQRHERSGQQSDWPGPINTEALLDDGELLEDMNEGFEYEVVSREKWHELRQVYKAGPEIPRVVVDGKFDIYIDVEPIELTLLRLNDRKFEVTIKASVHQSFQALWRAVADAVSVSTDDMRIYDWLEGMFHGEIDCDPWTSLDEAKIIDGQYLMVQERDENGLLSDLDLDRDVLAPPLRPEQIVSATLSNETTLREEGDNVLQTRGLAGLAQLGNTCFMNSAIQCLVHTPGLLPYFLSKQYLEDINYRNPIGNGGEIAKAFGDLVSALWGKKVKYVTPTLFKQRVDDFAPQFRGKQQQDAQELLLFLLDGLAEDLNRIVDKPYVDYEEPDSKSPIEAAKSHWEKFKSRNDSEIADMFTGQQRSSLKCPRCGHESTTFEPFMSLSIPIPSLQSQECKVTINMNDGMTRIFNDSIYFSPGTTAGDLMAELRRRHSVDEQSTIAILRTNPNDRTMIDSISADGDEEDDIGVEHMHSLIACVAPRTEDDAAGGEGSHLTAFYHRKGASDVTNIGSDAKERFGIPFVARLPIGNGREEIARRKVEKAMKPFLKEDAENVGAFELHQLQADEPEIGAENADNDSNNDMSAHGRNLDCGPNGMNADGNGSSEGSMDADEDIRPSSEERRNNASGRARGLRRLGMGEMYVDWKENARRAYNVNGFGRVEEGELSSGFVCDANDRNSKATLLQCIHCFTASEELGKSDEWLCPECKSKVGAHKKLDLVTLPKILVIHLKRFKSTWAGYHKLETFIDFPLDGLDVSEFVLPSPSGRRKGEYSLYALIDHYGGMTGGHYTASVRSKDEAARWFLFDDSLVTEIDAHTALNTPTAYILFYKREDVASGPPGHIVDVDAED